MPSPGPPRCWWLEDLLPHAPAGSDHSTTPILGTWMTLQPLHHRERHRDPTLPSPCLARGAVPCAANPPSKTEPSGLSQGLVLGLLTCATPTVN